MIKIKCLPLQAGSFNITMRNKMKNLNVVAIVAILVSGTAMGDDDHSTPSTATIVSTMNGTVEVGTFVSASPGQWVSQSSSGILSGSTTISGTNITPVITSNVVGYATSSIAGTGVAYPSFTVNGVGSSAVVQGVVSTTVSNYALTPTTIGPVHHD